MKPTGPIPNKVKCIKATSDHFTVGEEYIVESDGNVIDNHNNPRIVWDNLGALNSKFQPIYTDEELLEYAKKMYPEGTRFFNDSGQYRESKGVEFKVSPAKFVEVKSVADSGSVVYPDIYSPATGWVEIIDVEQQEKEYNNQSYKFKEGDPVISNLHPGVTGFTVCGFYEKEKMYLISSPTFNKGHKGVNGAALDWGKAPNDGKDSCWWVHEEDLVLDNQLKEKDIDISQINVGDYVKIIDKPADGRKPIGWNPYGEMDYLYGTWQDVLGIDADGDVQIYSSAHSRGVWSVALSSITAVKSYNPSGCDVAIKGGDVTVTDIVDVAPSKLYADHFANSMRAPNFQMLRAMQTQYNMHQHGIQQLIRDSEDHLMFGNKVKEDMLPVPSLRVSRKNIVK